MHEPLMYTYIYIYTHRSAGHQEIVFGDSHELVANTPGIQLDEFEYDQTSVRRTATVHVTCQFTPLPRVVVACRELPASVYTIARTDFPFGVVWWQDYNVAKRRGEPFMLYVKLSITVQP